MSSVDTWLLQLSATQYGHPLVRGAWTRWCVLRLTYRLCKVYSPRTQDPNLQRRADHHQRWCHHLEKHSSSAPCSEDGECGNYSHTASDSVRISLSISLLHKMSRRAMARHQSLCLPEVSSVPQRRCCRKACTPLSLRSRSKRRRRRPLSISLRSPRQSTSKTNPPASVLQQHH